MSIMSKSIYKFTLTEVENRIIVPEDARFLFVANQREQICVWAEVDTDPNVRQISRTLYVVGTGHLVPNDAEYIGSLLMEGGTFVFHVYEEKQQ